MQRGIFIDTKGTVRISNLGEGEHHILLALQKEVDGFIEIVYPKKLPQPFCFVCNDDGMNRRLAPNLIGTALYHSPTDYIAGNIVILKSIRTYEGLDITGLLDDDINILIPLLAELNETNSKVAKKYGAFEGFFQICEDYKKCLEGLAVVTRG